LYVATVEDSAAEVLVGKVSLKCTMRLLDGTLSKDTERQEAALAGKPRGLFGSFVW
jgi:hypothetical protein